MVGSWIPTYPPYPEILGKLMGNLWPIWLIWSAQFGIRNLNWVSAARHSRGHLPWHCIVLLQEWRTQGWPPWCRRPSCQAKPILTLQGVLIFSPTRNGVFTHATKARKQKRSVPRGNAVITCDMWTLTRAKKWDAEIHDKQCPKSSPPLQLQPGHLDAFRPANGFHKPVAGLEVQNFTRRHPVGHVFGSIGKQAFRVSGPSRRMWGTAWNLIFTRFNSCKLVLLLITDPNKFWEGLPRNRLAAGTAWYTNLCLAIKSAKANWFAEWLHPEKQLYECQHAIPRCH